MKGNTDIQVFPVFVLLHQCLFHIGQMNQVQNAGPIDLVRLLEDLCGILQRFFHLLQIFHLFVDKTDLHFQRLQDIRTRIVDRHVSDLVQRKSKIFQR